jgi:DnaK suppressor protein
MLNESQKGQLRTALETERARLVENAKDGLQLSMNRERNIGRDSIAESMEEEIFSTELRLRDREKYLLGKIDESLRRLDDNTADECEDCAEPIGFKRLLARPVTTFCIDCKEEREKAEQSQAQQGRSGGGSREDIGGNEEITGGTEE